MGLAVISLFTGLAISAVAIYYSVAGLTAIFAAAAVPIMVMGVALEVAKLVATVWLKQNWKIAPSLIKAYLVAAVGILMFITSMGIFGFLSKAHSDQSLVSGDVQSKIAIYDEKIRTARENIEADRKQLKQMDEAVDQVMARSTSEEGATKATNIRRSQQRDRVALAKNIEANQKLIAQLNDEAAPIRAEIRKVEAEVGPIKYIAAFVYGDNPDTNLLERAVTWVIVIIVFVFDPLAVVLLLAAQYSFARMGIAVGYEKDKAVRDEEERVARLTIADKLSAKITNARQYISDSVNSIKSAFSTPVKKAEGDSLTTESDQNIVEEATVTVPEVVLAPTEILDDAKQKLATFVEIINKNRGPEFSKFESDLTGFDIPKINSAEVPKSLADTSLSVTALELPKKSDELDIPVLENEETWTQRVIDEEKDLPEVVGVDTWNKMLEEAERAVEVEKSAHQLMIEQIPVEGTKGQKYRVIKGGEEVYFEHDGEQWNEVEVESIERPGDYLQEPAYVQNEEQQSSNLWQETRKTVEDHTSLSQEDYQQKVHEATIRELVAKINSGEISIDDLNDQETSAIADYLRNEAENVSKMLKKDSDDGQDNTSKST